MKLLAYISEQKVVTKILTHLGLPTTPQPLAPARLPAQLDLLADYGEHDAADDDIQPEKAWPPVPSRHSGADASRAPPRAQRAERLVDLDLDQPSEPADWDWGA